MSTMGYDIKSGEGWHKIDKYDCLMEIEYTIGYIDRVKFVENLGG